MGSQQTLARKIVYVTNHAAFFVSHRLPLAMAAMRRGYSVLLLTGQAGSESMECVAEATLHQSGISHLRVDFTAAGANPLVELKGLIQLVRLMRAERPDLVHCASPKGILYGAIAARLSRARAVVLAVSGMGYAFTAGPQKNLKRSLTAMIYRFLARFSYGHANKVVIVQNTVDRMLILSSGLAEEREVALIPGSGVDVAELARLPIDQKRRVVLFAGRMILEKGVMEFIEAARVAKREVPEWRFVMAGTADYRHPSSVPAEYLRAYEAEGIIEWLGHVDDMRSLYRAADIVCLPSYREGMPKVLLEAAACGCSVVTTDVPGCRDAILEGVSGDLVPPRNGEALAKALLALIGDPRRRERYAAAGRILARTEFGVDAVVDRTVGIYDDLLTRCERFSVV